MRLKQPTIPDARNRCHSLNSGQESQSAIVIWDACGAASEAMNRISEGIETQKCSPDIAMASMRFNCEFDSYEMNENDLHCKTRDDPRISTFCGISIDSSA
jgi:hypothetical protein